jgi:nicotinamidase-related amidase
MDKFVLDRHNALLVIVDIQDRLADVMSKRQKVTNNCLHLIEAAKLLNVPILVTEQYSKGLGPTIHDIKNALPLYEPVEKITFDCCREPSFMERAASQGKNQIILTGMETHICVLQTCLGLLKDSYTVHLVKDATCSRRKDSYLTALDFMENAGAVITCTETVLFQLLERAGTNEFKVISKRIK